MFYLAVGRAEARRNDVNGDNNMTTKNQILALAVFGNLGLAALFLVLTLNQLRDQEKSHLDDTVSLYQQAWKVAAEEAFITSVGTWHPKDGDAGKRAIWQVETTVSNNPLFNAILKGQQSEINSVVDRVFFGEFKSTTLSFVSFLDANNKTVFCQTAAEGYGVDPCGETSRIEFSDLGVDRSQLITTGSSISLAVQPDLMVADDLRGIQEPSIYQVMHVDILNGGQKMGTIVLGKHLFEAVQFFEAEFDVKVVINFNSQTIVLDNYADVRNYFGISDSADIVGESLNGVNDNKESLLANGTFGYINQSLQANIFGFPVNDFTDTQQALFMVLRDQRVALQQSREAAQSKFVTAMVLFLMILLANVWLINYAFNGIAKAIKVLQALVKGDDTVSIEQTNHWLRSEDDEVALLSEALEAYRAHLIEMEDIKLYQQYNRQSRDAIMIEKMRHLADQLEGDSKRLILSDVAKMQQLATGRAKENTEDASVELMSVAFSRMSEEVTALLDVRTQEMQKAYEQASDANREIQSSINYAAKLQRALLRTESFPDDIKINLTWQPRDVVGGDIYVVRTTEQKTVIAVIDCTGHGVPGAFTSVIARSVIDRAIQDDSITTAGGYLSESNRLIKDMLFQNESDSAESDAGFDGTLCILDRETGQLEFAGANSSLFVFNNGVVTELKGDRKSVGARRTSRSYKFTTQVVDNPTGMFIMLTDGVTDVMNEMPQPTAFGRKRLTRVIESMNTSDPQLVVSRLMQEVDDYKGPGPLRDDLTLLAFYIDELKHFDKHSNIDSPPEEALEVI